MVEHSSSGGEGHKLMWEAIGVVFILLVIFSAIGRTDIPDRFHDYLNDVSSEDAGGKLSFVGVFFPTGDLEIGQNVTNKGEVIVRSEPGGQILGRQKAREIGKILDGPVDAFGKTWWRIDYRNPPDGWVVEDFLTNHNFGFGLLNIAPITYGILKPFLIFFSVVLIVLIFLISLKLADVNRVKSKKQAYLKEQERMKHHGDETKPDAEERIDEIEVENLPTGADAPRTENVTNRRWANIQSLINSHSINDWKQAIIEADIILDEMLEKMGYKGDSVGDKLQKVERSDFLTLDDAWEGHKIRNRIAHKGSGYILSRDDAERAIESYKKVFTEFYYI